MTPEARPASSGLIPAHAGKTPTRRMAAHCRWAHPRSRGENRERRPDQLIVDGSSPLTRGKLPPGQDQAVVDRLIPAHAGKTAILARTQLRRRAHPRSRGENGVCKAVDSRGGGSSPLTRGKHFSNLSVNCWLGLIPAHAGKTIFVEITPQTGRGSSPLTRGKPLHGLHGSGPQGLIPAHAGKTW